MARLVKKIVIGYQLPTMPSFLIQGLLLLRSKLARAGFQVEVALCPLNQLPADTNILFVPVELVDLAGQAASQQTQVIPLTATTAQQPAYNELLERLKVGQELYAAVRAESESEGDIIRYRGYTRIT
jgi:hypothetical protein